MAGVRSSSVSQIDYAALEKQRAKARLLFEDALRSIDLWLDHGDWPAVERSLEAAVSAVRKCKNP